MPRHSARRGRRAQVRLDIDERRAQLVALGKTAFSQQPYEAVSVTDLADAAGMSRGLLYHYFPTKRDFYVASLQAIAGDMVERMTAAMPDHPDPLARVRASLDAYLDHVGAHGPSYQALMRGGVGTDPGVVAIVDGVRRGLIEQILEQMGEAAEAPPLMRVALRGWLGFVEAWVLEWLSEAEVERGSQRVALRDLSVELLAATLSGVAEKGAS